MEEESEEHDIAVPVVEERRMEEGRKTGKEVRSEEHDMQ